LRHNVNFLTNLVPQMKIGAKTFFKSLTPIAVIGSDEKSSVDCRRNEKGGIPYADEGVATPETPLGLP
jgi:hypothetical protein